MSASVQKNAVPIAPQQNGKTSVHTSNGPPELKRAAPSVIIAGEPQAVTAGEALSFCILAVNAGPAEASESVVTCTLPDTLSNAVYDFEGISAAWNGRFSLGRLAAGSIRMLLLHADVSPAAAGSLAVTAGIESKTPDFGSVNHSCTFTAAITRAADLCTEIQASPEHLSPGGLLTYDIQVSNAGPSDAEQVILTDSLPEALQNAEYSLDGAAFSPWTGSLAVGTIPRGKSRQLRIRAKAADAAASLLCNAVAAAGLTLDPNPANNRAATRTPLGPAADLAVRLSACPAPVLPGGTVIYSLAALNFGPDPAKNVRLSTALPLLSDEAEYSPDDGGNWFPWSGNFPIRNMEAGTARTILIRTEAGAPSSGLLSGTAQISGIIPDPNPGNNCATLLLPAGRSADLRLEKTIFPSPVRAGERISCRITVTNLGPNPAEEVVLNGILPAEITHAEFSLNGGTFQSWPGTCAIGVIPEGASVRAVICGQVSSALTSEEILNFFSVSAATPDPVPENNADGTAVPVTVEADVEVRCKEKISSVQPGNLFSWTAEIRNRGPSDARNVIAACTVPPALLSPRYTLDGQEIPIRHGTCALGQIKAGTVRTLHLCGNISSAADGEFSVTAAAVSESRDPNLCNNLSSVFIQFTPLFSRKSDILSPPAEKAAARENPSSVPTERPAMADLHLTRTGPHAPSAPGAAVTSSITIRNEGPDAAEHTLLYEIAAGLSRPELSLDGGVSWTRWINPWQVGRISAGEQRTLLIRSTIAAESGSLSAASAAVSATPDPDPSNNIAVSEIPLRTGADLSLQQSVYPNPVHWGEAICCLLTVSNAGPEDAAEVQLSCLIPTGVYRPSYSLDHGRNWLSWNGSYEAGTLPAGESFTLLLTGTVCPAEPVLSLTASVSSPVPDLNPGNNRTSAALGVQL